jgi:muramoyltetrapeptide carboxypeptidase
LRRASILEGWGLNVDFGRHAFEKKSYLAGTDEERLADLDEALRDPDIRAVLATRGGKGSYRIADRLDFDAARRNPKFLVGFSDITILHLSLYRHCGLVGLHGALSLEDDGSPGPGNTEALYKALMLPGHATIHSRTD